MPRDVGTVAQIVEPVAPTAIRLTDSTSGIPNAPIVASSGGAQRSTNPDSAADGAGIRLASAGAADASSRAIDRNFAPAGFGGAFASAGGGGGGGGRVGSGNGAPKGNSGSSSSGSSGENDPQPPENVSNISSTSAGDDAPGTADVPVPDPDDDNSSTGNDDSGGKSSEFPQQGATNPPVSVPEPGTLGLLLAGLLSCAAARRKR